MVPTDFTISTALLRYMEENHVSISAFAALSGVNSGTLSRFLHAQLQLSVASLDAITRAMGLEEGHFYAAYVQESTANWRRLGPYIIRCAEIGKLDCIEQAAGMLTEHLSYSDQLFDCAEELYHQGYAEAALILYTKVAESEKYQHSERLSWCQYRIFTSSLNADQEHNLNCAIQFEPYVRRLPEALQLDGLKDLANILLSLRKWDKARGYAQEMGRIARMRYNAKHHASKTKRSVIEPAKPLFGYILYSDLILGSIAAEHADYELALEYVSRYEEHSWVVEGDEAAEDTKQQFKVWATANRYLYQLMMGKVEVLDAYMAYISSHENEILRALFNIVQAANRYQFEIERYLEPNEHLIAAFLQDKSATGTYTGQMIDDGFAIFLADVGEYYLRQQNTSKGIGYLLDALEVSYQIRNPVNVMRCKTILEHLRSKLSHADLERYEAIRQSRRSSGMLVI
ncbi:helix-turn-helix transcriptional regulator [Paenibacillus sp. 7541]|uniref:helix-turn-helix domain-containing protein n=1 Tax=Paenibacillus sp. 7541 TaxID=2026236 RepID=UPI000BA70EE9|nr:helix-turn-helix transcriptional regulator [Paenibacillus sp. 7541]PAK49639.1 transcriptional regulator [Paenibacillus sp. 7541]